jgi:hypothetical protein
VSIKVDQDRAELLAEAFTSTGVLARAPRVKEGGALSSAGLAGAGTLRLEVR